MKIAVISPAAPNLEAIAGLLGPTVPPPVLVRGGMSRLCAVAAAERPDVVIVEGMCRDVAELAPLEQMTRQHPRTAVIVICAEQTPEFLINAMRAGVREVLPASATADALQAAVARAAARSGAVAATPRPPGKVIAFMACKGGSGATFIAANLGWQLAIAGQRVLLIDLNLQFGDAVLYVHDRRPATTLADVARNVERLDATLLAASLVQVRPGFGVLAAPEDPAQAAAVRPEHVDALLALAVREYDFVVVDVGRALDAVTLRALDRADRIFPVLQMTLPFVRDAARLLAVFRSLGYAPDKIGLVVNRHGPDGELTLADVERTLGVAVMRTLRNSYGAVAASVNRGVPIGELSRGNPVARGLADFAAALLARPESQGGWFGRLLKRA